MNVVTVSTVTRTVADDLGHQVDLGAHVRTIVSLVPSLTESVAAGCPDLLVACTDWCTHPADLRVERIRGTKNPDVRRIVELAPDLVLANREENRKLDVERLRAAGIPVWVTVTETVVGALDSLHRVFEVALQRPAPAWLTRCDELWRRPRPEPRARVAIPIWRDPWMVVGRDTFAGDLVAQLGLDNVFAKAPGRYPQVRVAEIEAQSPDLVLLPDEPYVFSPTDGPEAFTVPTELVSGRLITWYGPSLLEAWATLPDAVRVTRTDDTSDDRSTSPSGGASTRTQ